MSDQAELAPDGAGSEAVTILDEKIVETVEEPNETEGDPAEKPEGDDDGATAEAKAEEDRKSRNQRRREAKLRMQEELQEAQERADRVEAEMKRIRDAAAKAPRPKESDFASFDEYQVALTTHAAMAAMDQRRVQELEATAKAYFNQVESVRERHMQEDAQSWAAQMADGRARYPDFDVVALQQAPIATQAGAEAIRQSDYAADIAYALGKDAALGQQFAEIEQLGDDRAIARFVGRMEAIVTAPKPKTATNAPDPITPVRPSGKSQKRIEDMTPAEYEKWRASGGTFKL